MGACYGHSRESDTNEQTKKQIDSSKNDEPRQSTYYMAKTYRNAGDLTKEIEAEKKQYIATISDDTKKHIAATHLFGSIWHKYFMDDENKCEYMDYNDTDSYFNILDHMLIRGGSVRDVIWEKDFNDVDVAVNTRELTKLHLLHLKKYHSTKETQENSKCILWLHYAKKFDSMSTKNETAADFANDDDGKQIMRSNYMLNAKFLLEILENAEQLKDKISLVQGRRVYNIKILDEVIYDGYDLSGFDMDFLDIKIAGEIVTMQERAKFAKYHEMRNMTILDMKQTARNLAASLKAEPAVSSKDKYRAMYSIRVQSQLKLFQDVTEDFTAQAIDLPIYPLGFTEMSKYTDLTMNSMLIHYGDVIKDEYGQLKVEEDEIDYDWRSKVMNPMEEIDGIKDCKNKRMTVWGITVEDVKEVIVQIKPDSHLFRVVKMWQKLKGEGDLDENIVTATMELYPTWFMEERFGSDDEICKDFAEHFISWYASKGVFELRFECLEMLGFNERCKELMQKVSVFKSYIIENIVGLEDEEMKTEIRTVMEKYGYDLKE